MVPDDSGPSKTAGTGPPAWQVELEVARTAKRRSDKRDLWGRWLRHMDVLMNNNVLLIPS